MKNTMLFILLAICVVIILFVLVLIFYKKSIPQSSIYTLKNDICSPGINSKFEVGLCDCSNYWSNSCKLKIQKPKIVVPFPDNNCNAFYICPVNNNFIINVVQKNEGTDIVRPKECPRRSVLDGICISKYPYYDTNATYITGGGLLYGEIGVTIQIIDKKTNTVLQTRYVSLQKCGGNIQYGNGIIVEIGTPSNAFNYVVFKGDKDNLPIVVFTDPRIVNI